MVARHPSWKQLKREPALEYMYRTEKRKEELATASDAEQWHPREDWNMVGQLT